MRPVSLAVITTLNHNLLSAKLRPLSAVASVGEIHMVCDWAGPPVSKVTYHTTGLRKAPFDREAASGWRKPLQQVAISAPLARFFLLFWVAIRHRCSIVMAYNLIPHGMAAWVVARALRRRLYVHLIGSFVEIDIDPRTSDTALIKKFSGPSRLLKWLMQRLVRNADLVFVPGSVTARRLAAEVGVDPARIVVLHSAVDTERFRPQPAARREYEIITTAAFTRRKRYDRFFEVIRRVSDLRPGLRVAVLGTGPDEARIREMVDEFGLQETVTLLGYHERTEDFYPRARVFVLTSDQEGLSLASMEAMSCGLPVVVSDVGDMADVAISGTTGFLVTPPDDVAQYCDRILRLLDDGEMCESFGTAARQLIRDEHSPAGATRVWETLHRDSACSERPSPFPGAGS